MAEDGPADEPAAELLGATARCFFAPCELDDAAVTAGDRLDAVRGWPRVAPPRVLPPCEVRRGPDGEDVRGRAVVGAAAEADVTALLPEGFVCARCPCELFPLENLVPRFASLGTASTRREQKSSGRHGVWVRICGCSHTMAGRGLHAGDTKDLGTAMVRWVGALPKHVLVLEEGAKP